MSEPVPPLSGARARGALIGIEDAGLRGQVTLKGDLGSPALADAVREAAAVDVPGTWTVRMEGGRGAVWMAPDELLLLVPYAEAPGTVARLEERLSAEHHMALDVSDTRVVLRLTGVMVPEVLAKGVPCDVSERAFPPGTARRTHMGGIAVAFWRLSAKSWEIVAFRSVAHHLMAWLEDAAQPGSEVGFF